MFGPVAKTYYANKIGKKAEDIVVVSIMPCTAKKFENQRLEKAGIDFNSLPDGTMDSPLGLSSGAADIFANTGGVMEAAIRTAYEIVTGKELPMENLHIKPIMGLDGIKKASLKIEGTVDEWSFLEGVELKVAVVHSLSNARKIIEAVENGEELRL